METLAKTMESYHANNIAKVIRGWSRTVTELQLEDFVKGVAICDLQDKLDGFVMALSREDDVHDDDPVEFNIGTIDIEFFEGELVSRYPYHVS